MLCYERGVSKFVPNLLYLFAIFQLFASFANDITQEKTYKLFELIVFMGNSLLFQKVAQTKGS